MAINVLELRPAGYAYLLKNLELEGMPHWHTSFVSSAGNHRSKGDLEKLGFSFEIKACEKIYRRHIRNIPRIKF